MEKNIQNHGFLVDPIAPEDYLFGQAKLKAEVLQPDRQWFNFLPTKESQNKNGLETHNCTNYGTLNAIETLFKRLYGYEVNYSERYTGVETGTTAEGNSIQKVIETIRKSCGLIFESYLPFDNTIDTLEKYYSPKPMSPIFEAIGKNWLMNYKLGHEWIFTAGDGKSRMARLKECLQYSPIGVSVSAWTKDDSGIYIKEPGDIDNHWVLCYGYKDGQYWLIFDSYDNSFKKLAWNYDFGFGKRFTLEKLEVPAEKLSLVASLYQKMVDIMKMIIEAKRQLIQKVGAFLKGR